MLLTSDASANAAKRSKLAKIIKKTRNILDVLYPYAHLLFPLAGGILAFYHSHILLGGGENSSGDNMYHVLNEFIVLRGILSGDNPFGPLGIEFGMPILRFYQPLFYLWNVAVTLVTGIDIMVMHNVSVVFCFALSPFAYCYFLRQVGLNRFAAGIASFASMLSVAAFGNSLEAFHQAGIVTQSMGGLFFPWFMGRFVGMLRGENRASTTALLFAIACVSHAIMSVFAVFTSVLYFVTRSTHITVKGLVRCVPFAILGALLVSFWILPFIEHTHKMRPIPDSVVRGPSLHWFTSVSKDELGMVLFTGRLLDDPPRKRDDRNAEDEFMDKISIIPTVSTRAPFISVLTGLGFLVALFTFRRSDRRFILSGFLFALFLFAGPDDYPWQWHLPFMKNIQSFRCTYLVEFFGFGLVGIAVEVILRRTLFFVRRRRHRFVRWPLLAVWLLGAGALFGTGGDELLRLGKAHVNIRNTGYMDKMIDALRSLPGDGRPYRIQAKYSGRWNLRHGWFARYGFIPYCTHWKGVGPTAAWHLCGQLGSPNQYSDLNALVGTRYYSGSNEEIQPFIDAKDGQGFPAFDQLKNGPDRAGKSNAWHKLMDSGRDHFLRPLVGEPFPVVCTHKHWIRLARSWTGKYRSLLWDEETPIAMRVQAGQLANSGILDDAQTVFYLDHSKLEEDREALTKFVDEGGILLTPTEIEGIETIQPSLGSNQKFWQMLPNKKSSSKIPAKDHREEVDPGFEIADITVLRESDTSHQNFAYDIDALRSLVAVLPMEAVPGWTATLDGKPLDTFATGPDMLGVYIPQGAHRLVFTWKMPTLGWIAIFMTLAGLIGVLAIWGHGIRKHFRRRHATKLDSDTQAVKSAASA